MTSCNAVNNEDDNVQGWNCHATSEALEPLTKPLIIHKPRPVLMNCQLKVKEELDKDTMGVLKATFVDNPAKVHAPMHITTSRTTLDV